MKSLRTIVSLLTLAPLALASREASAVTYRRMVAGSRSTL